MFGLSYMQPKLTNLIPNNLIDEFIILPQEQKTKIQQKILSSLIFDLNKCGDLKKKADH